MFSKRSFFFTVGLILLVAITSYISIHSSVPPQPSTKVYETGIIHNLSVTQLTALGKLSYVANTPYATQYSNTSLQFKMPRATVYNTTTPTLPPWKLSANKGSSYQNNKTITLTGDVRVARAKSAKTAPLLFTTSTLTLLPHQNQIKTAAAVRISQPGTETVTTGKGLFVNLLTKEATILSDVESFYEPNPQDYRPSNQHAAHPA